MIKYIPTDVVNEMKRNFLTNYSFTINKDIPLKFQVYDNNTLTLFSYLYMKYICKDNDELQNLREAFSENQVKNTKAMQSKYNLTNHLQNIHKQEEENAVEEKLVVLKKESFISKILKKIKALLKK